MLPMILIVIALFGIVMLGMAVGVLVQGKCLRGSCGGPDILDSNGDSVLCSTCPNRSEA